MLITLRPKWLLAFAIAAYLAGAGSGLYTAQPNHVVGAWLKAFGACKLDF